MSTVPGRKKISQEGCANLIHVSKERLFIALLSTEDEKRNRRQEKNRYEMGCIQAKEDDFFDIKRDTIPF